MGEFKTIVKELETDIQARSELTSNEVALLWAMTQMAWIVDDLIEKVRELESDTKHLRDPYQ